MGNSKSSFRKLGRKGSLRLRMATSMTGIHSTCTGTSSRSHSLASTGTVAQGSDCSRLTDYSADIPTDLTSDQLDLVKYSWHLVSVDTSNVCLNFFHQLQRRFPRLKKKSIFVAVSTPSLPESLSIMSRNASCSSAPLSHCQNGQLSRQALKLACCVDAVIGSLMRHHKVKEEKVQEMLLETGLQFKAFLGFEQLYADPCVVRELSHAFCDSLRLVLVHNGAVWCQELQQAWDTLFCILLYHLDGGLNDEEDLHQDQQNWSTL